MFAAAPRLLSAQERGAAALSEQVEGLGSTARVLMIGAHPDDEDTRFITWLARGRHVETAYLSLTRGDGGQNLIGNELGDALGAIRTEELLAARRVDGARQYFTRAYDYGFSKTADEAFEKWGHAELLGDVVKVVRAFRPHVIVAVFSGTPADGHGHHQASGILAREVFDAALDTVKFPARAFGPAWTPAKFYRNTSYRGGEGATFRFNAGEFDPVLGRSYAEIAAESRSQHKSQGFGQLQRKGVSIGSLRREATRVNESAPAEQERSIFDGVDTTMSRFARALQGTGAPAARAALDSLVADLAATRRTYDFRNPTTIVPMLGRALRLSEAVCGHGPSALDFCSRVFAPGAPELGDFRNSRDDLRQRLASALAQASGLALEATVDRELVAVGDTAPVTLTLYNRSGVPATLRHVGIARAGRDEGIALATGAANAVWSKDLTQALAPDSAASVSLPFIGDSATMPWWLMRGRAGAMYIQRITGRDEAAQSSRPHAFVAVDIAGVTVPVEAPIVYRFADAVKGEMQRPLTVVPPITVRLAHVMEYLRAGVPTARLLEVQVRSAYSTAKPVTVTLHLPKGIVADSMKRVVTLSPQQPEANLRFVLHGQSVTPGQYDLSAEATVSGGAETSRIGYFPVEYDHITPQKLYTPAILSLRAVNVTLPPGANIAYVQGVGDNVAPMLRQLDLPVTMIEPDKIASTDLSKFTALVIGTRAYEAHPELLAANPKLFDWVRRGGTMVVQYGQNEMERPGSMPYPIQLSRPAQRVTIENAPVKVLDPASPLLNAPNRIGAADFDDWVQERATYMPSTFDSRYSPVLEMNDPNEAPNRGALLVAPLGKGTYVYATLALFRQLPAANPGAARLFVNLLGAKQPGRAVQ